MRQPVFTGLAVILTALITTTGFAGPLKVQSPESVGMSSAQLDRMKNHFQGLLDQDKTGGYQILVSRHGKVVMHENLGHASVEKNMPVTDDTLFRIFSMTKPVMAVAMMIMYEEGHFSLADPLSKHIPEFSDLMVYVSEDDDGTMNLEKPLREPTILDLLQHTAGFTYGIFSDTAVDKLYRAANFAEHGKTLQDLIGQLSEIPLLYQPGTRWVYSVSMDVQGYLVEKWSGQKLGDFLQERIFTPLEMNETLAWVPPEQADLLADIYAHDEEGNRILYPQPSPLEHMKPPTGFSGGAQLVSTSDDYWLFAQMLLNGGELDGKRILSPRTAAMISTNRLKDDVPYSAGYGFGINVNVVTDAAQIDYPASAGEYGWGGLATTVFWIDPTEDLIVIMMSQYLPTDNGFYRDLLHRMVHAAIIE